MSLRRQDSPYRVPSPEAVSPFCLYSSVPATTNLSLNYLVILQNQALQHIAEQNKIIASLIQRISEKPLEGGEAKGASKTSGSEEAEEDKKLRIVMEGELQTPVLKERGFALAGSVKDSNDVLAPQTAGTRLSLFLYTQDAPNTPLVVNIAGTLSTGKKAIRGSVCAEVKDDGTFLFPNIVINEVSSHYIDDVFTLMIRDESNELKPLIIRRLSVRARKAKALDEG